ncbi:hypothetical protein AAG906_024424 [Vitis piasezkii]|uniref:phytosulfokines 3-like n=1 Tax=Vitis riparia TaxID=96939 RepID=UPI00155AA0C6|nr:phytosulfokines 3-like [Vitis riparia]
MSPKVATFFILALFLCSTLTYAARPQPASPHDFPGKTQHGGVEAERAEVVDENCEGLGEDECLMRRTLAAHIDYIYTQKEKP